MNQLTLEAFLERFHPAVHGDLRRMAAEPETEFLVLYENRTLDSSQHGFSTAVAVGPGRTVTSLEEAYSRWLHDLPSQRQHPIAHCECTSPSPSTSTTDSSTTAKLPSPSETTSASG